MGGSQVKVPLCVPGVCMCIGQLGPSVGRLYQVLPEAPGILPALAILGTGSARAWRAMGNPAQPRDAGARRGPLNSLPASLKSLIQIFHGIFHHCNLPWP